MRDSWLQDYSLLSTVGPGFRGTLTPILPMTSGTSGFNQCPLATRSDGMTEGRQAARIPTRRFLRDAEVDRWLVLRRDSPVKATRAKVHRLQWEFIQEQCISDSAY